MTLLDDLHTPGDLRALDPALLGQLAGEIRDLLVSTVSKTGGHLGSNLGIVELTIALHRVFDSPRDRILFDTGHQTYVHKLLTGRLEHFGLLRQQGGLSGYPSRAESVHDVIENSHASTVLSYADGYAKAHALRGEADRAVVAVVGDGALTGGMAWEALNNIGAAPDRPVIIVLNDNGRSYCLTVGGVADHLAGLRATSAQWGDRSPRTLFEGLGIAYRGPVDGHDEQAVERALREARELAMPVVVHCVTVKGQGYPPAEENEEDRFHASGPFDERSGTALAKPELSWTDVFADALVTIGDERPDVVAITAAMLHPTGLARFAHRHPDRVYDVGIAEQHAVTSAGGLADGGMRPVVAVYSTFLNRAFDQVLMDVALHGLPVTFVLDRAGLTGDDGASHNGMWDMSILQVVPGLEIAVPRDGTRLRELLQKAVDIDGPTVVRFPKGAVSRDLDAIDTVGGMDVLARFGKEDILLVGVGPMGGTCVSAATLLDAQGIGATVVDPRWVKPLDPALSALAAGHRLVVVVEDGGCVGGVGDSVARLLRDDGIHSPLRTFGVPQRFLGHAKRGRLLDEVGLSAQRIAQEIVEWVARQQEAESETEVTDNQLREVTREKQYT